MAPTAVSSTHSRPVENCQEEMYPVVSRSVANHVSFSVQSAVLSFTACIAVAIQSPVLASDPGNDPDTLWSLEKILSIVAENEQLHAVIRMRLAQLMATRTADKLAFDRAREQFRRDLHDGVQQTIAAARMDLGGVREAATSNAEVVLAEELDRKLTIALEQVRSLKKGVGPPELRFGLKPAIDRAVAELRLVAQCRITEADFGVLTLPVYYLVRESLTNVHKHARAGRVEIVVTTDGRTIDVAVRVGASAARPLKSMGGSVA